MKTNRFFLAGAALVLAVGTAGMAGGPAGAAASSPSDGFASPEEAVPGVAPPGAGDGAVYLDGEGREIPMPEGPEPSDAEEGAQAQRFPCTPVSGRDYPHRSSTGIVISGHGWWKKGDCSNDRADVYNCLYEWYTDNSWRQKACSPTKRLKPGGGSANRTVARHDCDNTARTSWRNHVDVDVVGEWDTGEWPYRQADEDCRVF